MGLFYTSFINKVITEFKLQKEDFETFLESPKIQKIYKEYDIGEGSLHWALNMEEIYMQLQLTPVNYKTKIEEPLAQNRKDWMENDMSYLNGHKKDDKKKVDN